jgi:ribonuclease HII
LAEEKKKWLSCARFFLNLAVLKAYLNKGLLEAGCDEAGRGCLAGPVYGAAVILPEKYRNKWLNDSKKLNERTRYELREEIQEKAVCWAVASCDNLLIDEINILNASIRSMQDALSQLDPPPEFILVDGNRFSPFREIPFQTVVKGDATYMSIAAASVLAKTYRDDFMRKIHEEYPEFSWNINKGYPTGHHRKLLVQRGPTPYHRKTFHLKDQQLAFHF